MADAIPASAAPKKNQKAPAVESKDQPSIEYIGEGADKIKFTVDPRASRIRVLANGLILVNY